MSLERPDYSWKMGVTGRAESSGSALLGLIEAAAPPTDGTSPVSVDMPYPKQTLLIGMIGLACILLLVFVYCKFFYRYCTAFDVGLQRSGSRAEYFVRAFVGGGGAAAGRGGGGGGGGGDGGLAASAIESIPSFEYGLAAEGGGVWAKECSICLATFELQEAVRQLPSCRHLFHLPCIDAWLLRHPTCPLCRRVIFSLGKPCHVWAPPIFYTGDASIFPIV